jgi:hypothetical protein
MKYIQRKSEINANKLLVLNFIERQTQTEELLIKTLGNYFGTREMH